MNEKCLNIDYIDYFKTLEQKRQYENLQREQTRRIKQQQLWFSMDNEQENIPNENSLKQIKFNRILIYHQLIKLKYLILK